MRYYNERSMVQTVMAVIESMRDVMLAGDADVGPSISTGLKTVEGAQDFRILRIDGDEAFQDNRTIRSINKQLGKTTFSERGKENVVHVMSDRLPELIQAAIGGKPVAIYAKDQGGFPNLTVIAPIMASKDCWSCHREDAKILGFVKFSVSLAAMEQDLSIAHHQALALIIASLFLTLIFTAAILRYSVTKPITQVTNAMSKAAGGDLNSRVVVRGEDEIAQMSRSFNTMTAELLRTQIGMQIEQDKLTTIIRSAKEAIIVADANDRITLVNSAAEMLLGKSPHDIIRGNFIEVLDDNELMNRLLNDPAGNPEIFQRGERILSAQAARIKADDGRIAGSALLIRDITVEKNLENELRKLSTIDGLTGLYNRRFLNETLWTELARSQRYKHSLSILMLDVDHFKKFNDKHGHAMGDKVLKSVAKVMQSALRQQDFACRYGGEEFLAILPETPSITAFNIAERLRLEISNLSIDGCSVTVSIGCASFPDAEVESSEGLVDYADRALYEAKRKGRNCCVLVGEDKHF
ncbi:MAG: diguanylate cyclase [Georgfuchsia sp.]